jgi:hypothetical protein
MDAHLLRSGDDDGGDRGDVGRARAATAVRCPIKETENGEGPGNRNGRVGGVSIKNTARCAYATNTTDIYITGYTICKLGFRLIMGRYAPTCGDKISPVVDIRDLHGE